MTRRSIFLVGYMGAGKSAVGEALAVALDLPFADLDDAIVRHTGQTIPEIFAENGESGFREIERRVLETLPLPAVVALGGGAFTTSAVREYCVQYGVSVYLEWPLAVLVERVGQDPNRPLARDPERFADLLTARTPIYRGADIVWSSRPPHRESVADVVRDLENKLNQHTGK